jgi:hypothetical protein
MDNKKPIAPGEVDFVFVHKDQCLLDAFTLAARQHTKTVNVYTDLQEFLSCAYQYPKDTKIVLGRTFHPGKQTGLQIAYHLHELGFKRLYLITFSGVSRNEIPDYLIHIPCDNGDGITEILLDE